MDINRFFMNKKKINEKKKGYTNKIAYISAANNYRHNSQQGEEDLPTVAVPNVEKPTTQHLNASTKHR